MKISLTAAIMPVLAGLVGIGACALAIQHIGDSALRKIAKSKGRSE